MNRRFYAFVLLMMSLSCQSEKEKPSEEPVAPIQTNPVEVLSVEDVQRLQNESETPFLQYEAIITPSIEKVYPFTADSGETIKCVLSSDSGRASMTLYKLMTRTVKLDSFTSNQVKDFFAVKTGDTAQDFSKKPSSYRAIVRTHSNLLKDSTVTFSIRIYKSKG